MQVDELIHDPMQFLGTKRCEHSGFSLSNLFIDAGDDTDKHRLLGGSHGPDNNTNSHYVFSELLWNYR